MTEQIKVSEVSSILRQQLEGIHTSIKLEEVGTVLQVSDGVARIYGLDNAEANELLQFDNGMEAIVMNLEEDNVGAVLLGPTDRIKEGDTVKRTGRIASIDVSEGMIGRVIDPLGNPIDGKGEILGETCEMPLERKAPRTASADKNAPTDFRSERFLIGFNPHFVRSCQNATALAAATLSESTPCAMGIFTV